MPTEVHYKLCPACRVEYTQAATRCIDCDVALVDGEDLPQEEDESLDLPPASELECVRVAPVPWIRALSTALQEDGVAHRVERASASDAPEGQRPDVFGDVDLFGLYVQSEHLSAARRLDDTIAAKVLPEEAPTLAEGEEEACPACGARLGADMTECLDCGLQFG